MCTFLDSPVGPMPKVEMHCPILSPWRARDILESRPYPIKREVTHPPPRGHWFLISVQEPALPSYYTAPGGPGPDNRMGGYNQMNFIKDIEF